MQNPTTLLPACLSIAFVVVGIGLIFTAVKGILLKRKHLAHAERVEGVVVNVERKPMGRSKTGKGPTTYSYGNFPVIAFTRPSGEKITFTSETGDTTTERRGKSTESKYEPGQKVTVIYDPDGALKPMIGGNPWTTEIAMAAGGIAFLLGAIVLVWAFGGRIMEQLAF